ncbi:MAG TPA: hypothetical protein VE360_11255, partial [Pyrinomonadaceae bacterium]|nr:hypothetical protein [Pyrinomonadaceae bacterium]
GRVLREGGFEEEEEQHEGRRRFQERGERARARLVFKSAEGGRRISRGDAGGTEGARRLGR